MLACKKHFDMETTVRGVGREVLGFEDCDLFNLVQEYGSKNGTVIQYDCLFVTRYLRNQPINSPRSVVKEDLFL